MFTILTQNKKSAEKHHEINQNENENAMIKPIKRKKKKIDLKHWPESCTNPIANKTPCNFPKS